MTDKSYSSAATPPAVLRDQIMDSRIPKNEREWWAAREIERLRGALSEIAKQYENQNLNHVDFRVGAKRIAEQALTGGDQ